MRRFVRWFYGSELTAFAMPVAINSHLFKHNVMSGIPRCEYARGRHHVSRKLSVRLHGSTDVCLSYA